MNLLKKETALIEQVSIDEAYLDLTELQKETDAADIATRFQSLIVEQTGLTASMGLAANKLVAKMASGHRKPAGLTIVEPGYETTFLSVLPVGKLFGIGPKWALRLNEMNITTIADLAKADLELLRENFGPHLGRELQERASGYDPRPVETFRETKSISVEQTFFQDLADRRELWRQIRKMASDLENRLQKENLLARTIALKLRFNNWRTITRAITLAVPTDQASQIATNAALLMRRTWQDRKPLRLLGLRVSNFVEPNAPRQLLLPY